MVNYQCYRCGWTITHRTKMSNHLERKYRCKPILNIIDTDELKEYILDGLNYNEYLENIKLNKSSVNLGKSSVNLGKSSVNLGKNIDLDNSSVESSEDSFEIQTDKKNNLICQYCNKKFVRKDYLENHLKKSCKMLKEFNNIYDYDEKTFGKNIYKDYENAGDIYIVQTDYINDDHYKIGITNNIKKRMGSYRCGNTYEPRLHYYISCKDIKIIDNKIKVDLVKYNVKREIFKGNVEELKNKIVEVIKKEFKLSKVYVHEPDIKMGDLSECTHCNKCFYSKNDLFDHLNTCEEYKEYLSKKKENKLECKFCNKQYIHKQSLHKHLKICKEKKKDDEVKESMIELVKILNQQNNDLKQQLGIQNKQIQELIKKAGINNSTINVQNNIKLLGYGDTDRSHLTDKDILKCSKAGLVPDKPLVKHSNFCVPYLIEKVHFDVNKPPQVCLGKPSL